MRSRRRGRSPPSPLASPAPPFLPPPPPVPVPPASPPLARRPGGPDVVPLPRAPKLLPPAAASAPPGLARVVPAAAGLPVPTRGLLCSGDGGWRRCSSAGDGASWWRGPRGAGVSDAVAWPLAAGLAAVRLATGLRSAQIWALLGSSWVGAGRCSGVRRRGSLAVVARRRGMRVAAASSAEVLQRGGRGCPDLWGPAGPVRAW